MRTRKASWIACLLVLAFLVAACGGNQAGQVSPSQSALAAGLKTLQTAKITYDTTMKAVADLYAQGKITDQDKAMAIKYGREFYYAYMIAVDGLQAGKDQDFSKAMAALSKLVGFVGQFTGGSK
ncbi:MAG: hypothetical protein AB1491_01810 [Thermodesulfobacteriota bacterium]